jgi:hypothetical protein
MELTSQESRQMFPFSSRSQAKALVRIASREGKRHRLNDQSGSQILAHHSLLMLAVLMLVTQMLAPSNTTRSFSFLWLLTSIVYGPHRRLQQFPANQGLVISQQAPNRILKSTATWKSNNILNRAIPGYNGIEGRGNRTKKLLRQM